MNEKKYPFELPALGYDYNAMEPYIDAQTMEIHHTKHHQAYVTNLNAALENSDLKDKTLEEILKAGTGTPAIRNNGGGHWNHSMFWKLLKKDGGQPSETLMNAINSSFGSYDEFKTKFSQAAMTRFGSGWAWLCKTGNGLEICSTANQDNPLMGVEGTCGGTPILGLDVWEHAYYLKYQNKRADYVNGFFDNINWAEVERLYNEAK